MEASLTVAVLWIGFSVLAGVVASNKGRSAFGFFMLAFLLTPLIGFLAALVVKPDVARLTREQVLSGESKKCPFCSEIIKQEAVVCRYCSRDLPKPDEGSRDGQFEAWLAKQKPPLLNLSPEERAEYRKAFDYRLEHSA